MQRAPQRPGSSQARAQSSHGRPTTAGGANHQRGAGKAQTPPSEDPSHQRRQDKIAQREDPYFIHSIGGRIHPRAPSAQTSVKRQPTKKEGSGEDDLYAFSNEAMFLHDIPNMRAPSLKTFTVPVPTPAVPRARLVHPLRPSSGLHRPQPDLNSGTPVENTPMPNEEEVEPTSLDDASEIPSTVNPSSRPTTAKVRPGTAGTRPGTAGTARRPGTASTTRADEYDELIQEAIRSATQHPPETPAPPVAPDDEADIRAMKTVEDVISFFSSHNRVYTPVKFVYMHLRKPQPGEKYRPYELRVVPRGQHNPNDYYVLSASGVVHMHMGQPSEVVSLSAFMKEAALFNTISKIKFFSRYIILKAFAQWRRNIRAKLFCETRRKMCRHFFISKNSFCGSLIGIKKIAMDLAIQPLVRYPGNREGLTKDRFLVMMSEQKSDTAEAFRATSETIEQKLVSVVERVTQRAEVPDLESPEALQQYLMALEEEDAKAQGKSLNKKTISMVKLRQNINTRMQHLKAAMDDFSRLPALIRLVDAICAEALFSNALFSMAALNQELLRRDDEKQLFFLTAVHFQTKEGVGFNPPAEEMVNMYKEICSEVIASVANVNRIVTSKMFRPHFGQMVPRTFNLSQVLKSDRRVVNIIASGTKLFMSDFAEAAQATKHFTKNRRWFAYVSEDWPTLRQQWDDRTATEQKNKDFLKSLEGALTTDDFREVFKQTEEAFLQIKEMVLMRRGCLVITSTVVSDFLQSKLRDIQAEVRQRLLSVASQRLERISVTLNARIKILMDRPQTLPKYANFVVALNGIADDTTEMMAAADDVEGMYEVGETYGCESQDAARRELVLGGAHAQNPGNSVRDRYEGAVSEAKEFKDNTMKDMARKLDTEIDAVTDQIDSTSVMIDSPQLNAYTTDISEVMEYLGGVKESLTNCEGKVKTYLEWQKLFNLPRMDTEPLEKLKKMHSDMKQLWETINEWTQLQTNTYVTPVAQADVEGYANRVGELWVLSKELQRRHHNEAADRMEEQLREEKSNMLIIKALGNKNLKKEHWMRILMNQQRAYDPSLSLDSLKQLKLFDMQYREVILEQSAIANGEAEIQNSLDAVRGRWEHTDFAVKPFRDSKDTFILDDVAEIVQQVEEDQLVLQSCMANRYAGGIRPRIEEWDKNLAKLATVIDEWVYVQGAWMYLEFIFSSEDIKKQLPTEAALF
jgi:dynein heavy chain